MWLVVFFLIEFVFGLFWLTLFGLIIYLIYHEMTVYGSTSISVRQKDTSSDRVESTVPPSCGAYFSRNSFGCFWPSLAQCLFLHTASTTRTTNVEIDEEVPKLVPDKGKTDAISVFVTDDATKWAPYLRGVTKDSKGDTHLDWLGDEGDVKFSSVPDAVTDYRPIYPFVSFNHFLGLCMICLILVPTSAAIGLNSLTTASTHPKQAGNFPSCIAVPISLGNITSCTGTICYLNQVVNIAIPLIPGAAACLEFISPDGISPVQRMNVTLNRANFLFAPDTGYWTDDPFFDVKTKCSCPPATAVNLQTCQYDPALRPINITGTVWGAGTNTG
jgi:hypothetical protein